MVSLQLPGDACVNLYKPPAELQNGIRDPRKTMAVTLVMDHSKVSTT